MPEMKWRIIHVRRRELIFASKMTGVWWTCPGVDARAREVREWGNTVEYAVKECCTSLIASHPNFNGRWYPN
jgi:hypothetical protein